MKKTIAAISAGALLVAGQAFAAGQSPATARVGDRLGAASGESSEFAGVPLVAVLAGVGIIAAIVAVASDDDSDSD